MAEEVEKSGNGRKGRRSKPFTLGEAAEELSRRLGYPVSHQTVWNWVRAGYIATLPRVGKGWHRIAASELERFITSKTQQVS